MRKLDLKSQSAMEYLMTYGWAILIVAVVLAVLFQLGIFSGGNFAAGALPGSCQVQKNAAGASLTGECLQKPPEFVANFSRDLNSYVQVADTGFPTANTMQYSMFMWIDTAMPAFGGQQALGVFRYGELGAYGVAVDNGISLEVNSAGDLCAYAYTDIAEPLVCTSRSITDNTWHFIGLTYSGGGTLGSATLYIDGSVAATGSSSYTAPVIVQTVGDLGANFNGGGPFEGYLANVQFYNISLSQSEIQALYMEGIGGAPIRPDNLTGWWPLNGNANDYSGNNNDGSQASVRYSSTWSALTDYVPP